MNKVQELLKANDYVLLDGAMGTMLFALGLENGAAPEEWNLKHPERVQAVHRQYIEAGSQIILTNTFGGSSYRLKLHGLQDRVVEINRAAAALAREVADAAPGPVAVAGSMGPTGELLAPMGTMTFEDAKAAFAEQATGLAAGGVDVLWVETMSDIDELRAAVEGARSVSDLPIVATMSFDTHGRTMMGITPAQAAQAMSELDLLAFGANCGANLADTEAAIRAMREVNPTTPLVAKANAGIPHWEGTLLVYDGTPKVMGGYARRAYGSGAQLIGACCGSTAAHIHTMAGSLLEGPSAIELSIPADQETPPAGATRASRRRQYKRRSPSD
jgi:methionine synthase I (cobalamin-dependent)